MDALAAAHRAGVLHRDVKPGNILLDRSGRVLLTDFGIATMEDPGDGSATHLTRSGELVGSLDYLAPERAQGAEPGPASDIWALGATLFAAVEGASPFRRTSTFSTLTAIVTEPLPEPRLAGHLGPVLQRLLDKRPDSRPEADEARELLQGVADRSDADTPTTTLRGAAGVAGAVGVAGAAGTENPTPDETERRFPVIPVGFGPPGAVGPTGSVGDSAGRDGADTPGFGPAGSGATPTPGFGPAESAATPTPGSGPAEPGAGFGSVDPGATPTPGFGPAEHAVPAVPGYGASPGFPGAPQPSAPATSPVPASGASPPTGRMTAATSSRRKGRALLAAAAVTVVLVTAGVTVALLNDPGDAEAGTGPTASATSDGASASATGRAGDGRSGDPEPSGAG